MLNSNLRPCVLDEILKSGLLVSIYNLEYVGCESGVIH